MAKTRACDWTIVSNNGTEVVAIHNPTQETFSGTLANFAQVINDVPLTTGLITSGGSGVIVTSGYVGKCCEHLIVNGHATAALTVDASFKYGDAGAWVIGLDLLLTDGTYDASLPAKAFAILRGHFETVRITASEACTGSITSYRTHQL